MERYGKFAESRQMMITLGHDEPRGDAGACAMTDATETAGQPAIELFPTSHVADEWQRWQCNQNAVHWDHSRNILIGQSLRFTSPVIILE